MMEPVMETSEAAPAAAVLVPGPPSLNVFQLTASVLTRPAASWVGLESRSRWWFPMLVTVLCGVALTLRLYDRAIVPMVTEKWEQAADNGQMRAEQLDKMESFMRSPAGMAMTAGQTAFFLPVIYLAMALGVWFGVGFVLGTKLRYRHALEIVTWSSLILIPAQILGAGLAWAKESYKDIHTGWGILLPPAETPSKLQAALTAFLDALGPFAIWTLVVVILGATALSGAPRKSVAWVMGGLYLALAVLMGAMAGLFTPAA